MILTSLNPWTLLPNKLIRTTPGLIAYQQPRCAPILISPIPQQQLQKLLLLLLLLCPYIATTASATVVSSTTAILATITTTTITAFNPSSATSLHMIKPSSSSPSTTFCALLRDKVASSRGDAMTLSNNSSRSNIYNGSGMPLPQRLASLLINIPLRSSSVSSINTGIDYTTTSSSSMKNDNNSAPQKTRTTGIRTSLAIAGGGSKALSALSSTPGASSTLIDASVLYERRTFLSFISAHPLPPAFMRPLSSYSPFRLLVPKDTDNDTDVDAAAGKNEQRRAKFSFVSENAASLLSNSALHQSFLSSPSLSQMTQVVGVGCTSTLVSVPKKRPGQTKVEVRKSLAHLCLSFPDGMIRSYTLIMGIGTDGDDTPASTATITSSKRKGRDTSDDEGDGGNEEFGKEKGRRRKRTRAEEEELLGNFILWTLVREQERRHSVVVAGVNNDTLKSDSNNDAEDSVDKNDVFELGILSSEQGDALSMQELTCTHPVSRCSSINEDDQGMELILQQKAQRIIDGDDAAKKLRRQD